MISQNHILNPCRLAKKALKRQKKNLIGITRKSMIKKATSRLSICADEPWNQASRLYTVMAIEAINSYCSITDFVSMTTLTIPMLCAWRWILICKNFSYRRWSISNVKSLLKRSGWKPIKSMFCCSHTSDPCAKPNSLRGNWTLKHTRRSWCHAVPISSMSDSA